MPRVLLKVGIAMIVAGVLTGVYYLYCTQFGGAQLGKFPAAGRSGSWTLSDGSRQSFPSGRASEPVSIDLDPAMNAIGLNWRGTVSGMVMKGASNEYRVWLFLAGRPVMQETFTVSRGENDTRTSWKWGSIGQFSVSQPGRYDLVLEETREPRVSVRDVQIEVRRNVVAPSTPILVGGAMLFVAGFALVLVVQLRGTRASPFVAVVGTTMFVFMGLFFLLAYLNRDTPGSSPFAAQSPVQPALQGLPASAPGGIGEIAILQAEPRLSRIGTPITLSGTNFGRAENHRVAIGGHGIKVELEVIEWSKEVIRVRIPDDPRLQMDRAYYYRVERIQPQESSNLFMFAFEVPGR
jgi:hypothetical protein